MSSTDSGNACDGPKAPSHEELEGRLGSLGNLGAYAEGDYFPLRQKRIKALLGATSDYIVFVDENDGVEWSHNEMEFHERFGEIATKVTDLLDLSATLLHGTRQFHFRYRLAQAIARAFDGDIPAAEHALADAVDRLSEQARLLYLLGGLCGGALFGLLGVLMWLCRTTWQPALGPSGFVVLLAACAGAMGALVSVLLRTKVPVTSAASWLYFVDGAVRILLGALAGFIASIAIKAGILGVIKQDAPSVLTGSVLAGAVERFVPSLVSKVGLTSPSNVRRPTSAKDEAPL